MRTNLRLVATLVATVSLVLATAGAASAKPPAGSDGPWYVYAADANCTSVDSGCVYTVTKQTTWKGQTASPGHNTCAKDTSFPDFECRGTNDYNGWYFQRTAKGEPWIAYSTPLS